MSGQTIPGALRTHWKRPEMKRSVTSCLLISAGCWLFTAAVWAAKIHRGDHVWAEWETYVELVLVAVFMVCVAVIWRVRSSIRTDQGKP